MPEEENTENPTPGEGGDNTTEGGNDSEGEGGSGGNNNDTNEGDTNMTTTEITVAHPVMDNKLSYEVASVAASSEVAISTDMVVIDAMKCKNNSMTIFLNVTTGGTITLKAGNLYPNSVLGDSPITLAAGFAAIQLEDISRYECKYDGTLDTKTGIKLVGDGTIAGKIWVVGKRVGVDTVANQNTRDYNAGRTLHYDATYTG